MKAAILGHPVAHSLSPVIHQAAYAALGLTDWQYERHDVEESALEGFIKSCGPQWAGVSLTMPLKVRAVEISDEQDDTVQKTGAANTLIFRDGKKLAFNTDVAGITFALSEIGVTSVSSARIIGGGATARSAVAALRSLGATDIQVAVRRAGATAGFDGVHEVPLTQASDVDLVINTIPADATDAVAALPVPLLDVIYFPWPTPLAARWPGLVVSGHRMLLGQAVEQVRLMTGREVTDQVIAAMDRALLSAI